MSRVFFDTSVLLAAFFNEHEHHGASLRALSEVTGKTGACATHTLAELYATTTRLPGRSRLSTDQALVLIENVTKKLQLVHLDGEEYIAAIETAAAAGVSGATVYDALLLACASKVRARIIYTWNVRHFQRAYPEVAARVAIPG
ncbi:MAG: PIN domain-containing protein [Candidatus Eremiobacteraeota bacterium]|nr:PIN domain-containing protein [Candidatus Eremiobacteraeota bacterium]MBC5802066.1 PIN domain-containing protein [Candidatus Eremiobacteraeota bacterium]MBC5822696.1 PIN domain-containing protein [Candidatus Eremiobacteraeota bacterium]